ncbi:hypothetical protein CUJ83_07135 [Methanocella sp. CWC-04]|uniref:Uncharacterized protein n=1 Tax=Methanooceanicella nereidis TaxID=2052831 RepID=A0AAP2RDA6_9EURY|nr:hypothetical protein [Methanocella sp. CWC-04]MCD1294771.1 hypothetical protein [Methanocella sp. CWC-04]
MLISGKKTLFEGISSREYYKRKKELRASGFNGCVHIIFSDFEAMIFYSGGEAMTALEESNRWMSMGAKYVEPVENKAIVSDGVMSAYELSKNILDLFLNGKLVSMTETELGEYISLKSLIKNIRKERNSCILKLEDSRSKGYMYMSSGIVLSSSYSAGDEKLSGEEALSTMESSYSGKSVSAKIYFIEAARHEKEVPTTIEALSPEAFFKGPKAAAPSTPVEARPEEAMKIKAPVEKVTVKPVEVKADIAPLQAPKEKAVTSVEAPVSGIKKPAPKKIAAGQKEVQVEKLIELKVVSSEDKALNIKHRSKYRTLETLEERNIAWVDEKALRSLGVQESANAYLIIPGGKKYPVKLERVPVYKEEGSSVILPQKLRKRLSLDTGSTLGIKA